MVKNERINALVADAEKALEERFKKFDSIAYKNTEKIMDSFAKFRVDESCFASTSGYGYGDKGRDTLDEIWADVFKAEKAFVRHNIVSGTHALTIALFGILRPGDIMLSVTGKPYDTLDEVIGINGKDGSGSLADFGVEYKQIDMKNGSIDLEGVKAALEQYGSRVKMVFIQRSKGYMNRKTLSCEEIGQAVSAVRQAKSDAFVTVDNCYGEFVQEYEPTAFGADIIVGSLIKNPGGGMAESGGYIAGTAKAVELCSYRFTCPGVGLECGASLGQSKSMYKGLFYAPHTVAASLKTAALASYVFERLGYDVSPKYDEERYDIIQTIQFREKEPLCAFCRGIQAGSPVDAYVTPEPWDMPGYTDRVIMAAGTFTSGASIELSADAPIKPPFTAFFQGGLTYESGKYGIITAANYILSNVEEG